MALSRSGTTLRIAAALGLLVVAAGAIRIAGDVLPNGLAVALAFALVLGLPGYATLRLTGLDRPLGGVGTLALIAPAGLALWLLPLAVAFVVHTSLDVVAAFVLIASAVALGVSDVPRPLRASREVIGLCAVAAATGALASRWERSLVGDALFHAGRVRKLTDLSDLSLAGMGSENAAHPHAGYVLPLLHAVDAAAISLTGLDPSDAYPHLLPACAMFIPLAVYGAAWLLGGRAIAVGATVIALWGAFAPTGAALDAVQQPSAFTFLVLVPATVAALALWSRSTRDRRRAAAVVACVLVVSVVHVTYVVVPLAMLAAVVVLMRRGWLVLLTASASSALVFAAVWALAVRGGARGRETADVAGRLDHVGGLTVAVRGDWIVHDRFEVLVALAALVPLLLAFRHHNARLAAIVTGAAVLSSVPPIPAIVEGIFGAGQATRMWAGVPWEFAAAAIAVASTALPRNRFAAAATATAIASFVWAEWASAPAPTLIVSVLATAAAVAVIALGLRRVKIPLELPPPAAAALTLVACAAILAGSVLPNARAVARQAIDGYPADSGTGLLPRVPDGVVDYFRDHPSHPFPIVLAEPYAAYQLVGQSTVYGVAMPEERTRAEQRNNPRARRRAASLFFLPSTSEELRQKILTGYAADYVVLNAAERPQAAQALEAQEDLKPVLEEDGWIVYRVNR
jgi:hypothetical protein